MMEDYSIFVTKFPDNPAAPVKVGEELDDQPWQYLDIFSKNSPNVFLISTLALFNYIFWKCFYKSLIMEK